MSKKTKIKIDPVEISYYFLDFCLQNVSVLFEPAIQQVDTEHIGNYRPDIAMKNLFNVKENEDFNMIILCDSLNKISNPDEREELKLTAAEIIGDIFIVGFNAKDKNLDTWKKCCNLKLNDFLLFMEYITLDNTLRNRFMKKLKDCVNEFFDSSDAEKQFDFNNMSIQYAINLIMSECEGKLAVAEMLDNIYYGQNDINYEKANVLMRSSCELIKELIIDNCEICINSIKFDALVETAELKGIN